MLLIYTSQITDTGLMVDELVDAASLPLLNAVSREGSISFTQPVHARIRATLAGETVVINGAAESQIRLPCSRCLEPFELKIKTDFIATAVPEVPAISDSDTGEEIELLADEMDVILYRGERIDLGDEVAQQIIMALPFNPLCRNDCKGLCSRCGANLNQTQCQCHAQDENSPFAVLKTLTLTPKKE